MKQLELAMLSVLLAAVALWWVTSGDAPQTVPQPIPQTAQDKSAASSAAPAEDKMKLRLDLLSKVPVSASPKNIFAPLQSLVPPPPPPPSTIIELPPLPDIEEPAPHSPEVLALEAARKALAEIHMVGYLHKGGDRQTGIFSWVGKLETGGIGDPIFGRFRVKELTATTTSIEETITHAEITLQLNKQR